MNLENGQNWLGKTATRSSLSNSAWARKFLCNTSNVNITVGHSVEKNSRFFRVSTRCIQNHFVES